MQCVWFCFPCLVRSVPVVFPSYLPFPDCSSVYLSPCFVSRRTLIPSCLFCLPVKPCYSSQSIWFSGLFAVQLIKLSSEYNFAVLSPALGSSIPACCTQTRILKLFKQTIILQIIISLVGNYSFKHFWNRRKVRNQCMIS